MSEIKVNELQDHWLDTHGGRVSNDLKKDKHGFFVFMADGYGGEEKVYLPTSTNKSV